MTKRITLFTLFRDKWKEGCGAGICEHANRIVLCRGTIPCDVLFIGEAPGEAEDTIGQPFIGPAGKLLDRIINAASKGLPEFTHALTNLVGCIPRSDEGMKAEEPGAQDVLKCSKRLEEFVDLCKPKLIVCVGRLSETWIMGSHTKKKYILQKYEGKTVALTHPAAILRTNIAQQGLVIQRNIINLQNALEDLR